ncbi:hypothetical protein ACN47E_007982 [Coniothyrium glycines]
MRSVIPSVALLGLLPLSLAAPALDPIISSLRSIFSGLDSAVDARNPAAVANALTRITPTARPSNLQVAVSKESSIWAQSTRTDFFQAVATQVASGIILDDTLNTSVQAARPVGENSINNNNPPPPTNIFPSKDSADAPYTLSETQLRQAIFIPPGFTFGQKRPVIFVPGTGSYGGTAFASNLRKLLTGQPFADPVWLNIPGAMFSDAQTNAEYIAYAINYISSISGNRNDIAAIGWSQGSLGTQWVLKYWPSTRSVVKDFLAVSADFKGTVLANALCLSPNSDFGLPICPPSVIQQEATSDFIAALRRDGGDSAYVPTTTFYSGNFDEIVQPQTGSIASAFLKDARGVGVTNNEVQRVCAGRIGGSYYGHAGLLVNPLVFALIVDALNNEGPGSPARLDLGSVCSSYTAPGLDVDDVLATNGLIPVAAVLLLTHPERRVTEPPLRTYVQ